MKTQMAIAALVAAAGVSNAQIAFSEDFESGVNYTAQNGDGGPVVSGSETDGAGDFLGLSNGADGFFGGFVTYGNTDGTFLTAMDIDSIPTADYSSDEAYLTWGSFSIAGLTNLTFSVDLAEDDTTDGSEDWDDSDFVAFQINIDGSGWTDIVRVINDGSQFNSMAFYNGATEVLADFGSFSTSIAGTGTNAEFRTIIRLDSGDEDIAIDNITISGIPAPATFALLGLGGIAAVRRRR